MKRMLTLTTVTALISPAVHAQQVNQKLVSDYCVSTTEAQVVQDLRKKGWVLARKTHTEGLGWIYIVQKNPEYKREADQQYKLYERVPRCKVVTPKPRK